MQEWWKWIYTQFDPVAFNLGPIAVHWYGIMYALALISAYLFAKWLVKHDKLKITEDHFESFVIYVEIGIILGARLGYVFFYDPNLDYYLTHPWQIFNPFVNGEFAGIRGFSFHGAIIGFLLGAALFAYRYRQYNMWFLMDIVAVAAPLGYIFGRIGNFLNQELVGRVTDVPWGVYIYDALRHPSQLYEAFLEGVVIFVILYIVRKRKSFDGQLAMLYGMLYAIARSIAEVYRAPDFHIGFLYSDWLTMGQLLSFGMFFVSAIFYIYLLKMSKKK